MVIPVATLIQLGGQRFELSRVDQSKPIGDFLRTSDLQPLAFHQNPDE